MRMNPFGWRHEDDACYDALLAASIIDDYEDMTFEKGSRSVSLLSDEEIEDLLQMAA